MWKESEARKRLEKSFADAEGLVVKPLTKEMDLENLSPTDCRLVNGVHLYLDVVNIQEHLDEAGEDKTKLKKLLRHLHVYERLVTSLLYDSDGCTKVHFQGARLHAVFYKPYDTSDSENPALERLTIALQFACQAAELATLLGAETGFKFKLEAGLETGETIATMNGQGGSRELLFVGEAANVAAKLLEGKEGTRGGPEAGQLIGDDLPSVEALPKKWEEVVKAECSDHPVSDFDLVEPRTRLDFDTLGKRTALVDAVTFYADLSGFTKLVQEAEDKVDLLRCLHAIRSEMRCVVRASYDGDHVQYQGDRIQGLFYEAAATSRYVSKSFEAAAAMQSAMKLCRELFDTLADVGMTVGLDHGRVLVSQLGMRGNRDIIVLGKSVPNASELQDSAEVGETRLSKEVFDGLEEPLTDLCKKRGKVYVSTADAEQVGAKKEIAIYKGTVEVVGTAGTGAKVVSSTSGVKPARSWSGE